MAGGNLEEGVVMRLGLSSNAAPDATLDELLAACRRRGLAALELDAGDGHGIGGGTTAIGGAAARSLADEAGVIISGFHADSDIADDRVASVASAADTPVLVGGGSTAERVRRATGLASAGVEATIVVDGDAPPDTIERILATGCPLAWDVSLGAAAAATAERLLRGAGDRLRHVRLAGGGPESDLQDGQGIGDLMATLALAGFDGTLVLRPSSPRFRLAWQSWLGRRGGWGCGSKADRSFVRLGKGG